ncbi:MAG: hypothetical protein JW388_1210 [Nitrospira sp.]|nr:hypothetical protein [Nitrospira sp.]
MTIIEMTVLLAVLAFAVLVSYLVSVLIQIRKTMAESEQLLATMNQELPSLISELRAMSHNLNGLAEQTREGVEHAAVLLQAGRESREQLRGYARRAEDNLRDLASRAGDAVGEVVEEGKEFADSKKTVLREVFDAGREAMRRKRDRFRGEERS